MAGNSASITMTAAAILTAALVACAATAAFAASEMPAGPYVLRSAASGKCLDLSEAKAADGQPVLLWDCHGGANQAWFLENARVGDKLGWTVRSALDRGKCLDVAGRGGEGTQLIVWSCSGGDNQAFLTALARKGEKGEAWLTVTAGHNGLCLDVQGGAGDSGTPIIVWPCGSPAAPNQLWAVEPAAR